MRRRQLLGVLGAGATAAIAGCSLSAVDGASEPSHPLSGTTTVRVDDVSDADRETTAITQRALRYWEDKSEELLDFAVSFELVEDDPDVIVAFADESTGCEGVDAHPDEVLGCAPLLEADHAFDPPVVARVVVGQRPSGLIEITAKHELGHLLGRGHGDAPAAIMSSDPGERIPLYETRTSVQELVRAAQEDENDAMVRYNEGVAAWNDERYETAVEGFAAGTDEFETAADRVAEARERAAELETAADTALLDRLADQLSRLDRRAELGQRFTATMREAAATAGDGDRTEAQRLAAEAEETLATFDDVARPSLREVAISLGLVQEFDRGD